MTKKDFQLKHILECAENNDKGCIGNKDATCITWSQG